MLIKYKTVINLLTLFWISLPVVVSAQTFSGNSGNGPSLPNPLGDKSILQFLSDIFDVIMVFAVPLIVFMIIYAGFQYVMAQGNKSQIENAHRALLYAVIGGVLILVAKALLVVICGTVSAFGTSPVQCNF